VGAVQLLSRLDNTANFLFNLNFLPHPQDSNFGLANKNWGL